jgi:hypothetical protein
VQARAIRALLPPKQRAAAVRYALIAAAGVATVAVLGVTGYVLRSPTLGWTGERCAAALAWCGNRRRAGWWVGVPCTHTHARASTARLDTRHTARATVARRHHHQAAA